MNCVLKYPGAKWRLAEWIVSFFPPHKAYLEPYCGSAAAFFHKTPSRQETINDLDGQVVNFFKMCRERPEELAAAVNLTPYARDEFEFVKGAGECEDSIEKARRFAVLCFQGRSAPSQYGGWKKAVMPAGAKNPYVWNALPERVIQAAARLKSAHIENRPALEMIERYNMPDCLIYADPPYLLKLRHGNLYAHEMGGESEHLALLQALNRHSGAVVLSGYDSDLYNDILRGWRKESTEEYTNTAQRKTEVLWIKA